MGLCGEYGEVIDLAKKRLSQGHPLNCEAIAKELGYVAWYLAETAHILAYPPEDIFQMNLKNALRALSGRFFRRAFAALGIISKLRKNGAHPLW